MKKDVSKMTKNELYHAIRDESSDPEFVKACIKENDKRMNEFVRERLAGQRG